MMESRPLQSDGFFLAAFGGRRFSQQILTRFVYTISFNKKLNCHRHLFGSDKVKFQFKYDINLACSIILQENLDKIGIPYEIIGMMEVQFNGHVSPEEFRKLELSLKKYGFEIIDDPKSVIVQKIKEIIKEMVYLEEKPDNSKISAYIAERMNLSYGHLSKIFSEITYTSVENFYVLQRVERVKQLITEEKLTCTEVAWKMNYSSVAHLSNQFKKTTGLTPSAFQSIIERRNSSGSSSS